MGMASRAGNKFVYTKTSGEVFLQRPLFKPYVVKENATDVVDSMTGRRVLRIKLKISVLQSEFILLVVPPCEKFPPRYLVL
jgi:hypothetical protein